MSRDVELTGTVAMVTGAAGCIGSATASPRGHQVRELDYCQPSQQTPSSPGSTPANQTPIKVAPTFDASSTPSSRPLNPRINPTGVMYQ